MPGNPNTSFIPKQGPIRRPRQAASRSVHLFSVISYIVLASTMVASIGSFFYARHVEAQLQEKVGELNQAISGFNEEDMNDVRAFNIRLSQVRDRLDNGASVRSIFESIEDATAQSVALSSLEIERFQDNNLLVKAKVETDTFDSSLFQRGVFERSPIVESVQVKELTLVEEAESENGSAGSGVTFVAEITVPVSEVPNLPVQNTPQQIIESVSSPTTATGTTVTEDDVIDSNEITP